MRRYVFTLLALLLLPLAAALTVSWFGIDQCTLVDRNICGLYHFQSAKLAAAPEQIDLLLVGDSSLGNGVNAKTVAARSGKTVLNLALAGATLGVPAIETQLREGYLLEPKVSVQVASFRPVYILGEVNKPGEYPYTQGLTIRGAVAKADGFTYRANEKRVFLKRTGEPGERAYPLTADFAVLPGDTIRFGERYF